MQKATELKVGSTGGSSVMLAECGGVQLTAGERILVLASVADRMVLQYKPRLVKVADREVEKLRNGHYQLLGKEHTTAKPAAKAEPKAETKEQPPAEDKSMGTKKKKTKRRGK